MLVIMVTDLKHPSDLFFSVGSDDFLLWLR